VNPRDAGRRSVGELPNVTDEPDGSRLQVGSIGRDARKTELPAKQSGPGQYRQSRTYMVNWALQ
jgi:hypothetical protein